MNTSSDVVNADAGAVVYTGELSAESNCAFSGETNRTGDFFAVTYRFLSLLLNLQRFFRRAQFRRVW